MLYPKNESGFDPALFLNPTSEYRATPLWSWNSKLEEQELLWQIEQLKKLGFGGFHIHVRTGLSTTYLGDEFMALVKACVEKARGEHMLAWLYDEDRWPSGSAGGYVTRNPDYRSRHLLLTRHPYREAAQTTTRYDSSAASSRTENGRLWACYDILLNEDGSLSSCRQIEEADTTKGFKLYAYLGSAIPSPWFNNQTYVDTLNPAAIQEFIRVTYEHYGQTVGDEFGKTVPAMFTDEPQFSHKKTLAFSHQDRDVILPWTDDLQQTFSAAYPGDDLMAHLPELLWDLPEGEASVTRYHYHDHVAERFSQAFADQCGQWCSEHGLMLTGHMMEEPTLRSQTAALGEAMRSYRAFQLPGIDMLSDMREFTTAKQAQSAARQYGRPGVMSELYGVTNWDFDFRGHKLQGDWQSALGVTVRVPHLSWVSMNGEAKRDYPATFGYQSPWYDQYPYMEDHFARVNTAMTRGKPVCHIGVIHPVESYWLHWGPEEGTHGIRQQMDDSFQRLTEYLLESLLDFDFISESLLPEQCCTESITDEGFPVGEMIYHAVLVPPVETLRSTTLERLERFRNAGGWLIFLGQAPSLCDALYSERGHKLWERSEHIPFDKEALNNAFSNLRELEILTAKGSVTDNLLYQLRQDGADRWLFVAHSDKPANPDIPAKSEPIHTFRLRGSHSLRIYNTLTGEDFPLPSINRNGWTEVEYPLYEHDSLLLRLLPRKDETTAASVKEQRKINSESIFLNAVPITLSEPNVLLLDMPEYALDGQEYRPTDEILRLDNSLRRELGWPTRGEAYAQPWVEYDDSTSHTLHLRYNFSSDREISGAQLALENAGNTTIIFNGQAVGKPDDWYVDKCISTVPLPTIVAGENELQLSFPYGKKVDVEACYLLGDFGVEVKGCRCSLTAPVRELAFGDITRQGLPFYGGNLTYHLEEIETKGDALEIEASCYRSHLLRVEVDGVNAGVIAYSPYKLLVKGLAPGRHKVDLVCYGTRINTFGQLHRNDRYNQWWGPDSWRTEGPSWTWEYRFWEQGILKTPEIRDYTTRANREKKHETQGI